MKNLHTTDLILNLLIKYKKNEQLKAEKRFYLVERIIGS